MGLSFDGEFLLAGGGDENDSWLIDRYLVDQIGQDATIGYIPVALPPDRYANAREWLTRAFADHDLSDIRMWTDLGELDASNIESVSAVYIGGGNTYRLLDELCRTNTPSLLREFVTNGGYLYGGSAGAIICGESIETTPDKNHVGRSDVTGLKLLPDTDIWCHYTDADDPGIHDYVTETDHTVIALPERSGVSVTTNRLQVIGYEPIRIIKEDETIIRSPDVQFTLSTLHDC